MKSKTNLFFCVFCGIVMLVCLICYSGYVSSAHYDVCTPYEYSMITGYDAVMLDQMPEGYLLANYAMVDDIDEMRAVEITYELNSTINDTMGILGNLCYYYGENGEWINVLVKDPDYWAEPSYDNSYILPPGEHAVFREYVLVPEDAEQISAHRQMGEDEEMIIPITK